METKICFKRTPQFYPNIQLDGVGLERVSSAKVLGVTISNNLKWTDHVEITNTKAATCLYPLRQLKRAGLKCDDLVKFYCCVVRSVLEHACHAFHHSLPNYLSEEIERIQRRAMRITSQIVNIVKLS